MYAVIETGGKQLRVQVGQVVQVERVPGSVGDAIVFDRVLMLGGDNVKLGAPTLDGVQVRGKVIKQGRDRKILIYTYKRRQNSNRQRAGHRQAFTAVKIEAIDA